MKTIKEYPISVHDNPLYKISYLLRYDTNFPTMITIIKRVNNQGVNHDQVMDMLISDLQLMGEFFKTIENQWGH